MGVLMRITWLTGVAMLLAVYFAEAVDQRLYAMPNGQFLIEKKQPPAPGLCRPDRNLRRFEPQGPASLRLGLIHRR